jgi:hypothetical protein
MEKGGPQAALLKLDSGISRGKSPEGTSAAPS